MNQQTKRIRFNRCARYVYVDMQRILQDFPNNGRTLTKNMDNDMETGMMPLRMWVTGFPDIRSLFWCVPIIRILEIGGIFCSVFMEVSDITRSVKHSSTNSLNLWTSCQVSCCFYVEFLETYIALTCSPMHLCYYPYSVVAYPYQKRPSLHGRRQFT